MEEIGYIYKISFLNKNDIYIGKTTNYDINNRLKQHFSNKLSPVYNYVKQKCYDIKNVKIEILDKINMKHDLRYLLNNSYNKKNKVFCEYRICDSNIINSLTKIKLGYLEQYYIYKFYNDKNYNLIKQLSIKVSNLMHFLLTFKKATAAFKTQQ